MSLYDTYEEEIEKQDLSQDPPEEEPQRQFWFIKKLRGIVKKKSEELGRPLSACTVTMGCQMNARDSEKLSGILESCGYVYEDD